jgi:DNA-binding response OmpR family regulator
MAEEYLILVVDDTPANLEVISEVLTDVGFEVATAIIAFPKLLRYARIFINNTSRFIDVLHQAGNGYNGEMALKRIKSSPPDLILLDVQMPIMRGFETSKYLKENPDTCDIPIIFMTALNDTENKVKGFSLGAVDYITKPFQEEELLARVKTHIRLRSLSKDLEKKVEDRTIKKYANNQKRREISRLYIIIVKKITIL